MIFFDNGLKISHHNFYLDAHQPVECSFISHAHSDHIRGHQKIIATPQTIMLCRLRLKKVRSRAVFFNQPTKIDNLKIELFPAGHILGAAQILLHLDNLRVVYTGDFKLKPGFTCPGATIKKCDLLIMESTYGLPRFRFPEPDEVVKQLCQFIDACFAARKTPVLLAYTVGKAQEAIKILGEKGYQLAVHRSIFDVARVYLKCNVPLKNFVLYADPPWPDQVLIFPPFLGNLPPLAHLSNKRTAFLSGWAVDTPPKAWFYHTDTAFALSDHCDFDDLLKYVQIAEPKKIFTLHGFPEFAQTLRKQGFDAEYLSGTARTLEQPFPVS